MSSRTRPSCWLACSTAMLSICLGYCADGAEKLLVYEYVANESLDKLLFNDFGAWTSRDILVYGEEIVLLYRSNIILLSSPAFVQLTITDTENFWQ
ncbi:hypothetical protein ACSBR2_009900 [Camellia fascicularis]